MSDEDGVKWDELVRKKETKDKQGVGKGCKISLNRKGREKDREIERRENTEERG